MLDFKLKKYRIVKNFNGYRVGQIVSFNGADATKYADKICSLQVAKPFLNEDKKDVPELKEETATKEVKEEKKKRNFKKKK